MGGGQPAAGGAQFADEKESGKSDSKRVIEEGKRLVREHACDIAPEIAEEAETTVEVLD